MNFVVVVVVVRTQIQRKKTTGPISFKFNQNRHLDKHKTILTSDPNLIKIVMAVIIRNTTEFLDLLVNNGNSYETIEKILLLNQYKCIDGL